MPQSVWWITMIEVVPSRRWLSMIDLIASSDAIPPALRSTWASPGVRPSTRTGSSRLSMHVSTMTFFAGTTFADVPSNDAANFALFCQQVVDRVTASTLPRRPRGSK